MENKIKIDIVVPPYSGHINPILELIKPFIKNEKYDICIYTGAKKKEFLKNLGVKCKVILPNKPEIFESIVNTSKKTNIFVSFNQFKENIKLVPEIMEQLDREFKERKPDVAIADFIAVPAGMKADELNIPWISSMPTPFIIESRTTTPTYMGGWYPKSGIFYKIRDGIGRSFIKMFKKIVIKLANILIKNLNCKLYNEKGNEIFYSSHSILALGMKELEFRDDFPEQVIWAGPCLSEFSNGENEFVKKLPFKKKILVTIGTHLLWGKDELVKMVEQLSRIFRDTAFIISLGDVSGKDEAVEKINENTYLYKYIDYGEILPVVDYVIHHGGAGILYSCVKYIKPAIIIPHDYDQFDFAVRADLAKIGIPANVKKIDTIISAIKRVQEKENWIELERLSKRLHEYNPSKVLETEIERLIKRKDK